MSEPRGHQSLQQPQQQHPDQVLRDDEDVQELLAVSDVEEDSQVSSTDQMSDISFYNVDSSEQRSNKLNFSLANARSLTAKLPSLVDMFGELDLHFGMITETWFRNNKWTQDELLRLSEALGIKMISKNRKGRGGGVAIAYNSNKITLKKYEVVNGNGFEIVAACGKAQNFSRKLLVIVLYIPPSTLVSATKALWESVSDTIEKAKAELDDPYIVIGGDTNRRPMVDGLKDFMDVTMLDTGPTRGTATLDEIATNFSSTVKSSTFVPLEDENGIQSDHSSVVCRATLPKVHQFTTTTINYRVYNEESEDMFRALLLDQDWTEVECGSASDAAVAANNIFHL